MKKIFIIASIIIFVLAISLYAQDNQLTQDPQQEEYDVGLLKSDLTLKIFGKYGLWEQVGAEETVKILGLKYKVISEDELANSELKFKIIIMPNARCLPQKAADNLRRYLQNGGKAFACYQTGYRNEENKYIGNVNNFHINDITGVDFYAWNNKPPKCEYLMIEGDIPEFTDKYVQLARNTAMFIKPHADAKVLAYFLNTNKTDFSELKDNSAAIIISKDNNFIYCGENLFAPENGSSPQVKRLIACLINMLTPNLVNVNNPDISTAKVSYSLPYKSDLPVCPQGRLVRILLGDSYEKISVSAENELLIKEKNEDGDILASAKKGELIYIEPVYVYGKAPYMAVYDQNKYLITTSMTDIYVEPQGGNLQGGNPQGAEKIVNLVKLNPNQTYTLKSYRNSLKIKQKKNNMLCYNYLTLEEYVAGVVPNEVPYYYSAEALKAMAVVARTFALSNINRHGKEGYDLCPTVHCQVYEGIITEANETNDAVNQTAGEYISSGGKYAYTTFHSTCGGVLEDVEKVWPAHKPVGYLRASFDQQDEDTDIDLSDEENLKNFIDNPPASFCKDVPRYRWKEKYTKAELEKFLNESLPVLLENKNAYFGDLVDVVVAERTKHGRIQVLKIIGAAKTYTLYKDNLRWMTSGGRISTGGLQSTLFYIEKNGDNFIFCGGGWGHGVGMCQSGAQGMAKTGYNYKDIIKHYYKDVEISSK